MTEEEKKAIEILKKWVCDVHSKFCKIGAVGIPDKEWYATETVLNLIQKQDREINKLNNVIDRLLRDIYECIQNDDNATILSIKDYGDYNTFEQIKDKYKEYFMKEDI